MCGNVGCAVSGGWCHVPMLMLILSKYDAFAPLSFAMTKKTIKCTILVVVSLLLLLLLLGSGFRIQCLMLVVICLKYNHLLGSLHSLYRCSHSLSLYCRGRGRTVSCYYSTVFPDIDYTIEVSSGTLN